MKTYTTANLDWLSKWYRLLLFAFAIFARLCLFDMVLAATYDVDTTTDDATLSACDPTVPNDCSLRGAIIAANQDTISDTINLPAGRYKLTIPSINSTESNAGNVPEIGDLDISTDMSIIGTGPGQTIISGREFYTSTAARVLHLQMADTDVTLQGVTLEGGYYKNSTSGSLIYNNAGGVVELQDVVLRDSIGLDGAPIVNRSNSGTLRITDASILSNYGSNTGAIRNLSINGSLEGPTLELTNVTIASTSQGSFPNNNNGTIRAETGIVTLTNVTLFKNRYGIDVESATVTLRNTLLVDNGDDSTGRNCRGNIISGGGNYSSDGSCTSFTQNGDTNSGGDPGMSDMTYLNGHVVVPLYSSSTLLNGATANCPATDQVGATRSAGCTSGAYEGSVLLPTLEYDPGRSLSRF